MNRFTFFLLLILFATVSCNKTWECECKYGNTVVDVITIKEVGRMGAKDICQSYETQNNMNGANQSCSLK